MAFPHPIAIPNQRRNINISKDMMLEAKRLDAIKVYLSHNNELKRNKNIEILRKKGEINYSQQNHKNVYPLTLAKDKLVN